MKILELFNGYGTASFALKRLGIDYELVGYSDIDKYANQCFKQNHCPDDVDDKLKLGDVTKIDEKALPDFDLLTGGFPRQAFSVAGKMQGELDPRGTLFYEIIRIAEHKQPKYMLLENVKGLTSKKFKNTFDKILSELNRIGYYVHWKVLNTKDYGIPQNRERVWFACMHKDLVPNPHIFTFPEKEELKLFVKDLLDKDVDSKYNLSEKAIRGKVTSNYQDRKPFDVNSICPTLKCGGDEKNFISPTLTTELSRGYGNLFNPKRLHELIGNWRRLTPNECFKLHGFKDNEVKLINISDTRAYKLAGNGQSVNVVEKILSEMFKQ